MTRDDGKENRVLQKQMKEAYRYYVEENFEAFDRAMASIAEQYCNNVMFFDEMALRVIGKRSWERLKSVLK
jgi:hypothetical protein